MKTFNGFSPLAKVIVVVVVLFIGMTLYARWTGKSFGPVNLLGQNAIGDTITRQQAAWSARVANRIHTQVAQPS
jgi:hypothetical protein